MAIIDRARLWIDGKLIENMISVKHTDASIREGFTPNGARRPIGTSEKPGEEMLEVELKPNTTSVIDFYDDKSTGKIRKAVVQWYAGAVKGDRWQWNVQVSEVNKPESDNEGKSSQSVKYIAIGESKRLYKAP